MQNIYYFIIDIINSMSSLGISINCFLIVIESIFPILPLGLFITILFINYGVLFGFFISWFLTILGCILSFYIFKKYIKKYIDLLVSKYKYLDRYINVIDKIKFTSLVLLISVPFTPAFLVNISAGLSNMKFTKFLLSIMIGKISLVLFWGLIGTNVIETINSPKSFLGLIIFILISYLISKIVNKKIIFD